MTSVIHFGKQIMMCDNALTVVKGSHRQISGNENDHVHSILLFLQSRNSTLNDRACVCFRIYWSAHFREPKTLI